MDSTSTPTGPSRHDAKLVDILLNSAIDGEYVRDQISGTFTSYDPGHHTDEPAREKPPAIPADLLAMLRKREIQAIHAAENGQLDSAVLKLTEIIADCPHYASAYNNRAQARRLQGTSTQDVMADLDMAVSYAADQNTLAQAFTQKAVVLKESGDQDGAFYYFSQGAKHGSEVAKMAVARENPYAKMCGNMVAQAMKQLRCQKPALSS
ncbi:hypothetical protein LPJ61_004108 [Coemansia biformis]|uniref:TPR-like protein n=1 Tax=Coemansia biformis TaxID=1286918 RepID=A0A9W8CV08_9FUNG|nr:hypothetical protein LPJ61_004108 [Coemansia biformis]